MTDKEKMVQAKKDIKAYQEYERDCKVAFTKPVSLTEFIKTPRGKGYFLPSRAEYDKGMVPVQTPDLQHGVPTLRDQFAMAALTGFLDRNTPHPHDTCAQQAYKYADAMLKEKEKRK